MPDYFEIVPVAGTGIEDNVLYYGESGKIELDLYPKNKTFTYSKVNWLLLDGSSQTVRIGNYYNYAGIYPSKTGYVEIIAEIDGMYSLNYFPLTVKVPSISVTGPKGQIMYVGDTATLSWTVDPSNAKVSWDSKTKNVAEIGTTSGKITAKSKGTTVISAYITYAGRTFTRNFTLKVIWPDIEIKNRPQNDALILGQTWTLSTSSNAVNSTTKNISWISSNKNVAEVIDGKITVKNPGITKITAALTANPTIYDDFDLEILSFSSTISKTPTPDYIITSAETANNEYNVWPASNKSRFRLIPTNDRREQLSQILTRALATVGGGYFVARPDSSKMLSHFLKGQGENYTIDFKSMNSDWSKAADARINDINLVLQAAESCAVENKAVTFCSIKETEQRLEDSSNWGLAVGKYSTSAKCTVEKAGRNCYSATIYYYLYDFYDFSQETQYDAPIPVVPAEMWELHHGGMSKFYQVEGINILHIEWEIGQRWMSGARIEDIS